MRNKFKTLFIEFALQSLKIIGLLVKFVEDNIFLQSFVVKELPSK